MAGPAAFVAIAFLAGLAVGYFVRSAFQRMAHAADLAAIEQLHENDIEVTLAQDPRGLAELWSEDAVRFNPGNPPAVGKQAIEAENKKFHAQFPDFTVLSYSATYRRPHIEDGLACEWGEHESEFRLTPDSPPVSWHAAGFHVLRRQSDGSWKFVTIVTR